MLSKRFTANEAATISKHANDWIDKVDAEITKAVLNGENEVRINLCEYKNSDMTSSYNEMAKVWYSAPDFFISHYQSRKFDIQMNGQCSIHIKWIKK